MGLGTPKAIVEVVQVGDVWIEAVRQLLVQL